jgi:tetratricopeptide (TPR) repeat protein
VSFSALKTRSITQPDLAIAKAAEMAVFILQIFSFLYHKGIAEEILSKAAEAKSDHHELVACKPFIDQTIKALHMDDDNFWDPTFFREGIQVLLSFSLVTKHKNGRIYSVHQLVHSWTRHRILKSELEAVTCCARGLLSQSITFEFQDVSHYIFRQTLVPHIQANNKYAIKMGIRKAYTDDEGTKFGLVYAETGYWKETEQLYNQVMETRKRMLGAEHPDTLTSMGNLASTYQSQGRWKEAEELKVRVMELMQRVLGAEHPDTLTILGNLASTYRSQGRWKEAEKLEVQVMETRKRVLGAQHLHTLTSMGNLASTYWNQGRWKEAEELKVQVMNSMERVLGKEHPDTLTSMGNLASTYQSQGRWEEAEELEVQVMETNKRVLGAEHPNTLTSMANLASIYGSQGRWKEAEELTVQVM